MADKQEKILYITTNGGENPEKASMPFVMANAAMAMDVEAAIAMQGNSVYLAQKGYAEHVLPGGGFGPIKKLIEDFGLPGRQASGLRPLHQRKKHSRGRPY